MADDDSYMAFLDKANAPLTGYSNTSNVEAKDRKKLKTMDEGAEVPQIIRKVVQREEVVYVTDADEPFEGVSLGYERSEMPDGESFAVLINHPTPLSADITTLSVEDWDKTGQYTQVVDAVKQAANGEKVVVYVVPRTDVKTEYWVVAIDKKGKRLVGAKALGVES